MNEPALLPPTRRTRTALPSDLHALPRLNTVTLPATTDPVVVLDQGGVVAIGTHHPQAVLR